MSEILTNPEFWGGLTALVVAIAGIYGAKRYTRKQDAKKLARRRKKR